MDTHDSHRLERHARRIEELRLWRNAREHPIEEWRFSTADGGERPLRLGDFWPEAALPIRLSAEATVPPGWVGLPVELELWLGGEGFVRLSNGVTGGLNPFHRSYPVAKEAGGGETLGIEAEVVSKGLFGADVSEPRLTHADLVVPELEVRALERDLSVIVEACEQLDGHDAVPRLLDLLDAAFIRLSAGWPSGSEAAVSRYLQGYKNPLGGGYLSMPRFAAEKALDVNRLGRELWSVPRPPRPLGPLPEKSREAARAAREVVAGGLAGIRREHPPVGQLALTGHAHLDLAWLWPLAETRRKARRTFSSVLGLMERYEDFVFNQSSAQLYEWIEGDDPELFGRIKERVAEGRVEPVGGMWTEADCQITSGEAFVRQLLHGQRYFERKFGRRSSVAWLPDAFGFSPGIPQLLHCAGMTGFFTAKLSWNETDDFPLDLFHWEGLDGSRVVAHTLKNPGMDYDGDVVPLDLLGVWRNFRGKRRHAEALFPFGWGDGGAGQARRCWITTRACGISRRCRACEWPAWTSSSPRCQRRTPRVGRRVVFEVAPGHVDDAGTHQEAQPRGRAPAVGGRGVRDRRLAARRGVPARSLAWAMEDVATQPVPRHIARHLHKRGQRGGVRTAKRRRRGNGGASG